uniref:Transposase (Putative), gypsy type n=1 Tax=Tanacetum cinerariifolium TaxID=118510 RepID=A0A699HZW9_TANCI|nr:hypothetical protein [Tanacetum cinerariifolium]
MEPAKREVKLLTLTEGRTVSLNPPVSAALGDSGDIIDKLFDKGNDDVSEETVTKDVSEVVAEKTKKKQKRKVAKDASGSTFPPKRLRKDHHVVASNTRGKSLAFIRDLVMDGSSFLSGVTKPPAIVFVPPTPDDGPTDFVSNLIYGLVLLLSLVADVPVTTVAVTTTVTANASAVPPPKVRVVSKNLEICKDSAFASGANADAAATSKLNEPADSSDSFYALQDLDSETLHHMYVPKWNMTNDTVLDDLYVCRDLTDRLALPALFSQLRAMDYDQLYIEFNVGAVEAPEAIRLHGQISAIEAADAANELRDLNERNFVLEGDKDVLLEKVKTLESATALKEIELASLAAQVAQLTSDLSGFQLSRDELSFKVVSLESERNSLVGQKSSLESVFESFRERMEAMQDEEAKVLCSRVVELDAQLLEVVAHLDEEFYPCFLTAIFGRRWILTHGLKLVLLKCLQSLKYFHALGQAIGCEVNKGTQDGLRAGVDHEKAGRDLFVIKAYDPFAEAKYVEAMNALGNVDFSLRFELKSKKDASIVDLMDSFLLEGPLAEIPRARDLQPSPKQLRLLIHRLEDNGEIMEKCLSLMDVMVPLAEPLSSQSLIGEAGTSAAPATSEPITTLSTNFASFNVVPPLLISNDQVLHNEDPPVVTFEK